MKKIALAAVLAVLLSPGPAFARNVVVFVADGLRYDSVTPDIAPTLWKLRHDGVDFTNSHSLYPTMTTANASAIASGHYLGDTGDYANTLWVNFPVPCRQNMTVTFLESDCVLSDMVSHFGKGYMGQTTLIQAARAAKAAGGAARFDTFIVGKTGPAAIQDLSSLSGSGLLIDEATNRPVGGDGLPTKGPVLKGFYGPLVQGATGLETSPLSTFPDIVQEAYQTVAVDALLPDLRDTGVAHKPFVLVFWSRDPDVTQHSATDSEGKFIPGINGETQLRGIRNADNALKSILDTLKRHGLDKDTDVFATADHGFMTVAHGLPAADGSPRGGLPLGFLVYAVADWLHEKAFDPDKANAPLDRDSGDRPVQGSGLIGPDAAHPRAIVAANAGTDFIYIPDNNLQTARTIFNGLVNAPFTAALFVNDALLKGHEAEFKGALPMSAMNLMGVSSVNKPSIVVGFRSFLVKGCKLTALLCAAGIMDSPWRTGMGNHGGPSRAETRNFMAAIGPDFKAGFKDEAPVSNADITPTLAHILGLEVVPVGELSGRVATEALKGGKPVAHTAGVQRSAKAENGFETVLQYQQADGRRYFDAVGMPGRVVGLTAK